MKLGFLLTLITFLFSCSSNNTIKYNSRLKGFPYPFKVQNFKLQTQNQTLEMSYMDLNNTSTNVAVLLHGKNFAGFYWEKIAQDLMSNGYRVIIPDQIGFGKSSRPETYQYSFSQLSINTNKLLSFLNVQNFSLVGHSMGGMLAVTMADLYSKKIKKVVLINPIGLEDYGKYVHYKDPEFFYKNELKKTREKIINYQKKFYYDGNWKPEYEELVTPFARQINHSDWSLVAWNNALTYGPIFSESIIAKLRRTQVPIKIILGTRDRTGPGRKWKKEGVTHKLGQYHLMKDRVSKLNSKILVTNLESLGHLPHFEDYARFAKVFYNYFPKVN